MPIMYAVLLLYIIWQEVPIFQHIRLKIRQGHLLCVVFVLASCSWLRRYRTASARSYVRRSACHPTMGLLE